MKLADGTYQSVTVVGLDDTSLFGRPQLIQGKIEDIYGENGFHRRQRSRVSETGQSSRRNGI